MDAQSPDTPVAPVAMVTGGSRGLGAEVALALSARGYRVAVNYLQSAASALEVAKLASGPEVLLIKGDVSDPEAAKWLVHAVGRAWGRLDLLVNNAGVSSDALLPRTSMEDWDMHMRVNLKGCLNMTRMAAPLIRATGGGHMVNITSRSGLRGKAGQAAYSASKAALTGMTLSAARELAGMGIRVNAVAPGYTRTAMGLAAGAAMDAARRESLLGTLADPADLASFIVWLAGTSSVTGQVFSIDSRI